MHVFLPKYGFCTKYIFCIKKFHTSCHHTSLIDGYQGMKEAKEFLEAEHAALADEQACLRQANEATQLRLRTCEEELSSCRERLAESQAQRTTLDVRVCELG